MCAREVVGGGTVVRYWPGMAREEVPGGLASTHATYTNARARAHTHSPGKGVPGDAAGLTLVEVLVGVLAELVGNSEVLVYQPRARASSRSSTGPCRGRRPLWSGTTHPGHTPHPTPNTPRPTPRTHTTHTLTRSRPWPLCTRTTESQPDDVGMTAIPATPAAAQHRAGNVHTQQRCRRSSPCPPRHSPDRARL